jgi:hypothetical protein
MARRCLSFVSTVPAPTFLLAAAALLLVAGRAEAGSVSVFAQSTLTDPGGTVSENKTDISGPNPIFPVPLSVPGMVQSGGAEISHFGFADFGHLQARTQQGFDGSSTPSPSASSLVRVSFDDTITIDGGVGAGTFHGVFSLDGVLEALVDAAASTVLAEARYSFVLTVADGVFEWSGSVSEVRPGSLTTASSASITVGGSAVPAPAANPPGSYTTPALGFTFGVPFAISAELQVEVEGLVEDGTAASSSADFNGGFLWEGMQDLPAGAVVESMSGRDYVGSIPEPSTASLAAAGICAAAGVLPWRRRLRGRELLGPSHPTLQ